MTSILVAGTLAGFSLIPTNAAASDLKVGDPAPAVQLKTHEGAAFSLQERKGKGWTILYFYPKAGTPGCTKQACAFRDAADDIKKQNAEVFGVSTDTVEKQAAFHKEHKLTFKLLADADGKVAEAYGIKIPVVKIAKRWTFIIDPELKIRHINDKVDPLLDAKQMIAVLKTMQGGAEASKATDKDKK
jgi:peroxiredoxin Q/BCP